MVCVLNQGCHAEASKYSIRNSMDLQLNAFSINLN